MCVYKLDVTLIGLDFLGERRVNFTMVRVGFGEASQKRRLQFHLGFTTTTTDRVKCVREKENTHFGCGKLRQSLRELVVAMATSKHT